MNTKDKLDTLTKAVREALDDSEIIGMSGFSLSLLLDELQDKQKVMTEKDFEVGCCYLYDKTRVYLCTAEDPDSNEKWLVGLKEASPLMYKVKKVVPEWLPLWCGECTLDGDVYRT